MKFLFHWPLRDPTVSSSGACAWGPVDGWLCEQEAAGGLPIFILNQWSRSGTVSEVLFFFFAGAVSGNLNASRARPPPTQTRQILLQQQETIINDEASGPEEKTHVCLTGGSVRASFCLGTWVHLLVSVCRAEGHQRFPKRFSS